MVLIEALKTRDMIIRQHIIWNPRCPDRLDEDLRELRTDIDAQNRRTVGIIMNEPSDNFVIRLISGHHWYALRPRRESPDDGDIIGGSHWLNCDSKLTRPEPIESTGADCGSADVLDHLLTFLRERTRSKNAQAFCIVRDVGGGGTSSEVQESGT